MILLKLNQMTLCARHEQRTEPYTWKLVNKCIIFKGVYENISQWRYYWHLSFYYERREVTEIKLLNIRSILPKRPSVSLHHCSSVLWCFLQHWLVQDFGVKSRNLVWIGEINIFPIDRCAVNEFHTRSICYNNRKLFQ